MDSSRVYACGNFCTNICSLHTLCCTQKCITYLHVDLVNFCRSLGGSIHVCIVCLSDQFLSEIGSRVYDIVARVIIILLPDVQVLN